MMLLTETYKNRLIELAGINLPISEQLIKEALDLYKNSNKRVKFDINIMKQAIEGGMEVGMIFQSNNEKYKMPIWKTRIVQPVAMGYDKKGQLVIRGIHVVGQSEKKAIQTGIRSAEAKDEWRLFKVSNIKSIFLTGRLFNKISLSGYNPNDSAMSNIIVSFSPDKAMEYQKQLKISKTKAVEPKLKVSQPIATKAKIAKVPVAPKTTVSKKDKENIKTLQQKIDKLSKLK